MSLLVLLPGADAGPPQHGFAQLKAALLYADEVRIVAPQTPFRLQSILTTGRPRSASPEAFFTVTLSEFLSEESYEIRRASASGAVTFSPDTVRLLKGRDLNSLASEFFSRLDHAKDADLDDLSRWVTRNAPANWYAAWWATGISELTAPQAVPLLPRELVVLSQGETGAARPADAEIILATALLGELPAFPDADIDVVLDVRERLSDARIRFRSAIARAAAELADVPPSQFDQAIAMFRRQEVEPALLELRETLQDLGAAPTLLRMLKDKSSVPVVASIAIAAGVLDIGTLVTAGASAAAIATGVREALARREIGRAVRRQPYWYLRAVDESLAQSLKPLTVRTSHARSSSYASYLSTHRDEEAMWVQTAHWTDGDYLAATELVGGIEVTISNLGTAQTEVRSLELIGEDDQDLLPTGPAVNVGERVSSPLPHVLHEGDTAAYYFAYNAAFRRLSRVRVVTGGSAVVAAVPEISTDGWVMVEALVNLQTAARLLGIKVGSTAVTDPIERLEADHGLNPDTAGCLVRYLRRTEEFSQASDVTEAIDDTADNAIRVGHPIPREMAEAILRTWRTLTNP